MMKSHIDAPEHYVGLDVSLKDVSICVVDADRTVIAEGKVATEPSLILSWIDERIGAVERIVHESGPLSIWLTRELDEAEVRFFTLHSAADLEHSELGWRTVAKYTEELNLADEVVESYRRKLVVWETYFNGICHSGDALDD